jgi:hypothetical protein
LEKKLGKTVLLIVIILNLVLLRFNGDFVKQSIAHTPQNVESFDQILKGHHYMVSNTYYLFYGDSIALNFTFTETLPGQYGGDDIYVYLNSPAGRIRFIYNFFDYFDPIHLIINIHPNVNALWGNSEGNFQIQLYNPNGLFFGATSAFHIVGQIRHYTNTPPTGGFLTPANETRVKGIQYLSWDISDADGDVLLGWLGYYFGWLNPIQYQSLSPIPMFPIGYIKKPYFWYWGFEVDTTPPVQWDTTAEYGLADGPYTLVLYVWDFDQYPNYETYYHNYFYTYITIDNGNNRPTTTTDTPTTTTTDTPTTSTKASPSWIPIIVLLSLTALIVRKRMKHR